MAKHVIFCFIFSFISILIFDVNSSENVTIESTTENISNNNSTIHFWANQTRKYDITTTVKPVVNITPKSLTTYQLLQQTYPQIISTTNSPPKLLQNSTATDNASSTIIDDLDFFKDVEGQSSENKTLKTTEDHHEYYNSTTLNNKQLVDNYWKEIKDIEANTMLSTSHRRAITLQLSFDFPFYGHIIKNITIATGGFIYTGEYVHSWLAATQYIAPLMANFDTSLSNSSYVKYSDNGTSFTVLWENVYLQNRTELGSFTFSTSLYQNGNIVFIYYNVPIKIESIHDDQHPVKVGLSDAYIIDKLIFYSRRKTIYEYHRVNFGSDDITNSTVIRLTALPTCLQHTDCESCESTNTNFQCIWCPTLKRCSTGTDRKRQEWLQKGCEQRQSEKMCSISHETDNHKYDVNISKDNFDNAKVNNNQKLKATEDAKSSSINLIIGILIPICLLSGILLWVVYAFRNPHTKSGQLLIQYRPSQWSWKRGEARYTAATIHM